MVLGSALRRRLLLLPNTNKVATRVDDCELAHTPRFVLHGVQTRCAGTGQISRLTLGVQGVDIRNSPVTLGAVLGRRYILVQKEVHRQVAFDQDGVTPEFIGPPSSDAKTQTLVERSGLTEIARRKDWDGDAGIHDCVPRERRPADARRDPTKRQSDAYAMSLCRR